MRSYNRRRGRYRLPRRARLSLFLTAVVLLAALIILLAVKPWRSRNAQPQPAVASAPAETAAPVQAAQPEDGETENTDSGLEPGYAADGTGDALDSVEDVSIDLYADLAAAATPRPLGGNRSAVIRSMGDIVIHTPLLKTAYDEVEKTYDFSPYFSLIADSMGKADYSVINVDGPMGGKKFASYRGYPQFNTPPQILYALKSCGIDMLTLANNHMLDTYFDGLVATVDNVESLGLAQVGAYRSQAERDTPKIIEINGIKVGFLAYTAYNNNMAKRSDQAATDYGLAMTQNAKAPDDIKRLKSAGAEFVIVYMHWGKEYERTTAASLRKRARMLVEAGADAVIGGHPHVVLPAEWIDATYEDGSARRALALYSMGNFLSDQRARYLDSGIIYQITLQENPATGRIELSDPRYIPIYVHRYDAPTGYDYRVMRCASIISDPPADMPETVVQRVRQVWAELKEVFANGAVQVAES